MRSFKTSFYSQLVAAIRLPFLSYRSIAPVKRVTMHWPNPNLTFVVIASSFLCLIPAGYQLTVLNNPQLLLEQFVNASFYHEYGRYLDESSLSVLWSAIIAALAVGALSGCFLSVPISDRFGRKRGLLVVCNCCFLLVGSLLSAIAIVS